MNRREHKKAKRRGVRNFIIGIALLLITVIGYCVVQYNSGLSEASDGPYKDDGNTFEPFEGAEPEIGEMNILLIGSDARPDEKGLSDTLMIAHYNQKTNDVKIVSIMRDTYVEVPDHGLQKVNAAYAFGGPELVRKTIKHNFDLDIHYYAVVDFVGFPKIVDLIAPNGIEVDIPYEMSHGIGMTLQPGTQFLNGEQTLGYVRFRHDRLSDFGRVERQQEVLSKLKEQAISIHSLVNLPKILGVADPYIDTNIDNRTLLTLAKSLLSGKSKSVDTLRIPVADSFVDDRVNVGQILRIDFDINKQVLQDFLSSDEDNSPHSFAVSNSAETE